MKKNLGIFLFVFVAISCIKEDNSILEQYVNNDRIFTASFDQTETRTFIEDGTFLRWTAGDRISLFDGNTLNREYQFNGETGDNAGTFTMVKNPYGTGNNLNCNYAIYPYGSDVSISDLGVISASLPAEQTFAENSFGLGANTMVAITKDNNDTFLGFKNIGGYLKLQLYGDVIVKSITLRGNDNEKIAGKVLVKPSYGQNPDITMSDNATETITLDCGDGVKVGTSESTATAFWIVVPPTTFEKGFTVTVTDIYGGSFEKSTSNTISIERNIIKPMAAFKVNISYTTIPTNQIWYTSTDGKVVTPRNSKGFGANIISNTYTGEKGVITFDGKVTIFGTSAFRECHTLSSIIIPGAVVSIEDYALSLCSNLKTVTIPDSVIEINGQPFYSCHNLEAFYGKFASEDNRSLVIDDLLLLYATNSSAESYTIPANIKRIEDYAFYGTSNLTELIIPDNVETIGKGAFYGCKNIKTLTLGTGITAIVGSVFCSCSSLEHVSIPDNVTLIGDHSFQSCTSLKSVVIGNGVRSIEQAAFDRCTSLTDVYCMPSTPPSLGVNVFYDNASGRKVYVPYKSLNTYLSKWGYAWYEDILVGYDYEKGEIVQRDNEIWYTSSNQFKLAYNQSAVKLFGADIKSSEWDSSTKKGVIKFDSNIRKIGEEAFQSSYLTSISIPKTVTSIEDYAFSSCQNLTDFVFPDNLQTIGKYAFRSTSLMTLVIPDQVHTIGDGAFNQCWNLTTVHLGENLNNIGSGVFNDCRSLEKFTGKYAEDNGRCLVKDNVIIAYANASGTKYDIPDNITEIGANCFNDTYLTDVLIPEGVLSIGDSAFWGCNNMTSITIPESVTAIDRWAFYACNSMAKVYFKSINPCSLGYSAFMETTASFQIYVPEEAVTAYQTAQGWSDYASYIVGYDVNAH